jgi:hypothetical protein
VGRILGNTRYYEVIPVSIATRVQELADPDQAVVLARLLEARSETRTFAPRDLDSLFIDLGLPGPSTIYNALSMLERQGLVRKGSGRGSWMLTPRGRTKAEALVGQGDLGTLAAEAAADGSELGHVRHAVVPPLLAPPALIPGLRSFLEDHPFETNVFGMTRFPDNTGEDPVRDAVEAARDACAAHGLELHLASDRAIDDDLWSNVAAHMWASRYGIAFFEDAVGRGLNYNMTIEVGGMLMTGRRCALLKDPSVARMPTDLVGRIYKDVELSDAPAVSAVVHEWLRDDLGLGPCSIC